MPEIFNRFKNKINQRKEMAIGKNSAQLKENYLRDNSFLRTIIRVSKIFLVMIIVVVSLLMVIFGVAIYGFKANDSATRFVERIIPYPAAFSLGGVVTIAEFDYQKEYISHFYQKTNQGSVDDSELSNKILSGMMQDKLIKEQAIKFKIGVEKKDVQAAMQQIYDTNGGQAEVEKSLKEYYGLSIKEFEELVSNQILRENINKNAIVKIKASHILIKADTTATPDKVAEAKTRIDDVYNQIKAGLDFAEAAKKYSEDVGSNEKGGELDQFSKGDLIDSFWSVANSTSVGQISEPFKTDFGWHILKVDSKTGFINMSFDEWTKSLLDKSFYLVLYRP